MLTTIASHDDLDLLPDLDDALTRLRHDYHAARQAGDEQRAEWAADEIDFLING